MPLVAPNLDNRKFQDIVDEAKKRIPFYLEEWTDHNVSDPGVTMIELFAWMNEALIYRLNRVPERHYVQFMNLLGITLEEPKPARAPVSFWLSTPLSNTPEGETPATVSIPANTQVATLQTEVIESVVFSSEAEFIIQAPEFDTIYQLNQNGDEGPNEIVARFVERGVSEFPAFSQRPQPDDAVVFGFKNDLSHHILGFQIDCVPKEGTNIDPTKPPYVWEALQDDNKWVGCDIDIDETKGLNAPGQIRIHLPKMHLAARPGKKQTTKGGPKRYWVRLRLRALDERDAKQGITPYNKTPRLKQIQPFTVGGTTMATHAEQVEKEILGTSDGLAGQRFQLQAAPILGRERSRGETLYVEVPNDEEEPLQIWKEVPSFSESGFRERHFTLDSLTGELQLGPAIPEPDGTIKQYGAIPPRGARLYFRRYRHGGGNKGNVDAGAIETLKTSLPYVSRVRNRAMAKGGLDAERLDSARLRTQHLLRSRDRAVTEADFEFLAKACLKDRIERVKCLQPRPSEAGRVAAGEVYVLVIPKVDRPARLLQPRELRLDEADRTEILRHLNERRLLTTRLDVRVPAYVPAMVEVSVGIAPEGDETAVRTEILNRLYKFLNPLVGWHDETGWPFGRNLFVSDIYPCLQGIPNVQFIRDIQLFESSRGSQRRQTNEIEVLTHGMIVSGQHQVRFVER